MASDIQRHIGKTSAGSTQQVMRARQSRLRLAAALAVIPFSGLLGRATQANTADNVNNGSTDLTASGSYSGGSPATTNDVDFSNITYSPTTFTLNTPSFNLSIGTLDDLDATQTLTIDNTNGSGTSTITLNGGSNSVAPSTNDLLYVASGGTLSIGTATTGTLNLALGAAGNLDVAGTANIASVVSGSNGLTKTGAGTLNLSGAESYTGTTTANAGTLSLNFANLSTPTNLISSSSALVLGGGNLSIIGKSSGTTAQTFNGVTLNTGTSSSIAVASNGGTSTNLSLGAITWNTGATVNFTLPTAGNITTTSNNFTDTYYSSGNTDAYGLLVSANANWSAFATVNQTTWAMNNSSSSQQTSGAGTTASGIISGLPTAAYATTFSGGVYNTNVDVQSSQTAPNGFTVGTLRFNNANVALALGTGTNDVDTGGILVTASGNGSSITGNTITGNGGGRFLVIINYAGSFTIGSAITATTSSVVFAGTGTTTLTGTNTYTGATTVDAGTLALSGTAVDGTLVVNGGTVNVTGNATTTDNDNANPNIFIASTSYSTATLSVSSGATFTDAAGTAAFFRVGSGAASIGILNDAGTVNQGVTNGIGGNVGNAANSSGAIYNTGTFNENASGTGPTGDGIYVGNSVGAYGYIYNSGTFTDTGYLGLTRNDTASTAASSAVVDVAGGTFTVTNAANLTLNADQAYTNQATAQIDVTGGTLTAGSTTTGTVTVNSVANAYSSINVSGNSAVFTTSGVSGIGLNTTTGSNIATNTALVTVANGGTLNTSFISSFGTTSNNILTLNGGTLIATAANATALIQSGVKTYIQSGGTNVINNGGFSVTVAGALLAPSGNGVTGIVLGGTDSGYVGAPVVVISGGGGTGAAAIANFNPTTGTITGFTITSPGSGYTSTPTITLVGGSGTVGAGATAGLATASASIGSVTGGGITFTGSSTTTLTAASTYTGGTTIGAGTLRVNNTSGSSGTGTGTVTVQSGATLGGSGYVGTSGSSNGAITVNSGGTIAAGASTSATGLLTSYSSSGVALGAGSAYTWKINADTNHSGTAGGATGWDEIATQSITLGSSGTPLNSGSSFTVNITGMPSAGFGAGTQSFPIATAVNGISLNGNPVGNNTNLSTADPSDFVLSTSGFTAPSSASGLTTSWQLEVVGDSGLGASGQDLDLIYSATPEPGTAMLVLAGALPLLTARRRRRKAVANAE